MPVKKDGNLLVGFDKNDDAAVYKLSPGRSLVSTVDFFTPVVDDPSHFGKIAAANSLSDVYAMGGTPFLALNIIGFPLGVIPVEVLRSILSGAALKAIEAGVVIGGGHSIRDKELKFGMCVSGMVKNTEIIDNSSARAGDVIVLTKPVGSGIITTSQKNTGRVSPAIMKDAIFAMEKLNDTARNAAVIYKIRAGTDVTGFGLLGHLHEIASGSNVDIIINSVDVPLMNGVEKLASKGYIPGGTYCNHDYLTDYIVYDKKVSELKRLILCDAQTSGGLLLFCKKACLPGLLKTLKKTEICACVIGQVMDTKKAACKIFVK